MKLYGIDAFTTEIFKGNPAAVCILEKNENSEKLKLIAKEMNLSETAFVLKEKENIYYLRWFTPTFEISLCGHGTLAASYILYNEGYVNKNEKIIFKTLSGILEARIVDGWIELSFPTKYENETIKEEAVYKSLGLKLKDINYIGKSEEVLIIEVKNEEIINKIEPIYEQVLTLDLEGITVTCKCENEKYDFISRFFAPEPGIIEDPVTGSAHCILGEYWRKKLNKNDFYAYQASERGGELRVKVYGNKTFIYGKARKIYEGEFVCI